MKYKWKVGDKPTGRYCSFEKRMACYQANKGEMNDKRN
jgi:hypothetical protein